MSVYSLSRAGMAPAGQGSTFGQQAESPEQAMAAAGALQAQSDRSAAAAMRRYLDEGLAKIQSDYERSLAAAQSQMTEFQDRYDTRFNQESEWALQRANAAQLQLFSDPRYQALNQYVSQQFQEGVSPTAASAYAERLRTAQAARGMAVGGAATEQEAALLMQMTEQGRQAMAPMLHQLATGDIERPFQLEAAGLQNRQGAAQLASGDLASLMQMYGTMMSPVQQQQQTLASLFGQTAGVYPFSGASPEAARRMVPQTNPFANSGQVHNMYSNPRSPHIAAFR